MHSFIYDNKKPLHFLEVRWLRDNLLTLKLAYELFSNLKIKLKRYWKSLTGGTCRAPDSGRTRENKPLASYLDDNGFAVEVRLIDGGAGVGERHDVILLDVAAALHQAVVFGVVAQLGQLLQQLGQLLTRQLPDVTLKARIAHETMMTPLTAVRVRVHDSIDQRVTLSPVAHPPLSVPHAAAV